MVQKTFRDRCKGYPDPTPTAAPAAAPKPTTTAAPAPASASARGGAPWDKLTYELCKLLCMGARKMNVAIGHDLLGYQMVELGMEPRDCLHLKLHVMVGERFLATFTNARVAVALNSDLLPEEQRLPAMLEVRRVRKGQRKEHNRLEESILDHYKNPIEYDALRAKSILGHYLLHPLYMSTYMVKHVLELNSYYSWLEDRMEELIEDPTPLLEGRIHALQYWHTAIRHDPLMRYAHHTPAWGDADMKRMLVAGLEEGLVLLRQKNKY